MTRRLWIAVAIALAVALGGGATLVLTGHTPLMTADGGSEG